jgi:hypothetical protein
MDARGSLAVACLAGDAAHRPVRGVLFSTSGVDDIPTSLWITRYMPCVAVILHAVAKKSPEVVALLTGFSTVGVDEMLAKLWVTC